MCESVLSGHTSMSSTVPIARFSEEEKRVSVIKAPHYEGIGPVDDTGIPIAIRTVRRGHAGSHTHDKWGKKLFWTRSLRTHFKKA